VGMENIYLLLCDVWSTGFKLRNRRAEGCVAGMWVSVGYLPQK
jgi:hypothetical protein